MDQAVRAPAIMQELISGPDTVAVPPAPVPRYQPATIREIIEEEETPARPVIEMSDDEMPEVVPASLSGDSVDAMMEVSGESEEAGNSGATGRRGRRKKVPADLTFSSGRILVRTLQCSGVTIILITGGESDDPEFQPVSVKETKKPAARKTSTRAARTRKTKI